METTRHFTASMYVVNDGATVLHRHPRLDLWLPPGGHVGRDELPHEAALREVSEETGLTVELVQSTEGVRSETARPLPEPAALMLEDINVHAGTVGHQHIDFIYYGRASDRALDPEDDEAAPSRWEWFDRAQLSTDERLDADVRAKALDAIERAAGH